MKSLFKSTGLSAVLLGSGSSVCDVVKPRAEDQDLGSSMRSSWCLLPGERVLKTGVQEAPAFLTALSTCPLERGLLSVVLNWLEAVPCCDQLGLSRNKVCRGRCCQGSWESGGTSALGNWESAAVRPRLGFVSLVGREPVRGNYWAPNPKQN